MYCRDGEGEIFEMPVESMMNALIVVRTVGKVFHSVITNLEKTLFVLLAGILSHCRWQGCIIAA